MAKMVGKKLLKHVQGKRICWYPAVFNVDKDLQLHFLIWGLLNSFKTLLPPNHEQLLLIIASAQGNSTWTQYTGMVTPIV